MTAVDTRRLAALVALNDPAAVPLLDNLIADLTALRARLAAGAPGTRSEGGAGDRVRLAVIGPDGSTKQTADTGASP